MTGIYSQDKWLCKRKEDTMSIDFFLWREFILSQLATRLAYCLHAGCFSIKNHLAWPLLHCSARLSVKSDGGQDWLSQCIHSFSYLFLITLGVRSAVHAEKWPFEGSAERWQISIDSVALGGAVELQKAGDTLSVRPSRGALSSHFSCVPVCPTVVCMKQAASRWAVCRAQS